MSVSFKDIRSQLQISMSDLAAYLELSKARVHQFESGISFEVGKARERINHLAARIATSKKKPKKDVTSYDHTSNMKAEAWLAQQRMSAATRAEMLNNELIDMKAQYKACLNALNTMTLILKDPQSSTELKQWIKYTQPKLMRNLEKCDPIAQAKLLLRRDEALGRAKNSIQKGSKK